MLKTCFFVYHGKHCYHGRRVNWRLALLFEMSGKQTLRIWLQRSFVLEAKAEEECLSDQEKRQLFLNEFGFTDQGLRTIFHTFQNFVWREDFALNEEHLQSIEDGRSRFFKIFEEYSEVKEWNQKNNIPPAA